MQKRQKENKYESIGYRESNMNGKRIMLNQCAEDIRQIMFDKYEAPLIQRIKCLLVDVVGNKYAIEKELEAFIWNKEIQGPTARKKQATELAVRFRATQQLEEEHMNPHDSRTNNLD